MDRAIIKSLPGSQIMTLTMILLIGVVVDSVESCLAKSRNDPHNPDTTQSSVWGLDLYAQYQFTGHWDNPCVVLG